MENTNVYKGISIVLLVLIFIFIMKSNDNNGWDNVIKVIEQDQYYGKVDKKFIDTQNHNTPIIRLLPEKEISLYGQQWELIDVGDSISKKLNTTVIEEFKKDKVITIDQKAYIETLKNSKN